MRTIERSSAFRKDYKREITGKLNPTLVSDLSNVLKALAQDQPLVGPHCRDHDLSGNGGGYRECHIKPDYLLLDRQSEVLSSPGIGDRLIGIRLPFPDHSLTSQ